MISNAFNLPSSFMSWKSRKAAANFFSNSRAMRAMRMDSRLCCSTVRSFLTARCRRCQRCFAERIHQHQWVGGSFIQWMSVCPQSYGVYGISQLIWVLNPLVIPKLLRFKQSKWLQFSSHSYSRALMVSENWFINRIIPSEPCSYLRCESGLETLKSRFISHSRTDTILWRKKKDHKIPQLEVGS